MLKNNIKSRVTVAFFFLFSLLFFPSTNSYAETDQELRCYSECGVYKFAWVGNMCYDMVAQNCTIGSSDMVSKAASFIKDAYTLVRKNELTMILDVKDVFMAWFVCKPLIEDCIVPELNQCKTTCDYNPTFYAPNITVGNPNSMFLHGVYYNEDNNTLYFKVVNNGLGYAYDIGTEAVWGSTPNRDGIVSGGGELFNETIPELLFIGSRQGIPPTFSDTVKDFLIDESNFSSWLSRFKSDADKHQYIPPMWEKIVPFTPPDGQLTKVIFNVDPNQMLSESNELDNTYILEIDKRPDPAAFEVTSVLVERRNDSLTDYTVRAKVKNTGEEGGTATLKWFDGDYKVGNSSFYTSSNYVEPSGDYTFIKDIVVNVSTGSPNCSKSNKYSLIVTDEYGGTRTSYFEVPLYAGTIPGHVEDLFGDKVVDADVNLSNGMSTKTNKFGNYAFKGISQLGKLTVTISHKDFSQTQTKEVTLSFNPGNTLQSVCEIPGLLLNNTDFVLQDEPVTLKVTLKDRNGNLLTGAVKAVNTKFSHDFTVTGETTFDNIPPGNYQFSVSVPGFITQSQTIILTAPSQDIEFTLTKLVGRDNDNGLNIHTPELLWEKTLPDGEFISDVTAPKNGSVLVFYSSNSRANPKYGKMYFVNPQKGTDIKTADVPFTVVAQGEVDIDSSYDGRTIGMSLNPGSGTKEDKIVKLFDSSGNEYNNTTADRKNAVYMEVSPDGTYVYGMQLMNNSLYKYYRGEIMGTEERHDYMIFPRSEAFIFTRNNNIITKGKDSYEVMSFKKETIRTIGETEGLSRIIDTDTNENVTMIRTHERVYYFSQNNNWKQDVEADNRFISAAVSVGGEYVLTSAGNIAGEGREFRIFDRGGNDITPSFTYRNVVFVDANDTGLYFLTARGEKLSYYKVGSYDTDYNSGENTQTEQGAEYVDDLEVYNEQTKTFELSTPRSWYQISESSMYKAVNRTVFNTNFGTLTLSPGTIFSRLGTKPIIIYGQAQIHATSPVEMVLLKIKVYDLQTFYTKFVDYYLNKLPTNEYVTAKNLHTKYNAETKNGVVKVSVVDGDVLVNTEGKELIVTKGNLVAVDEKGSYQIKKNYSPIVIYTCIILILIGIVFVDIKHKKSKFIKTLIHLVTSILKKVLFMLTNIKKG